MSLVNAVRTVRRVKARVRKLLRVPARVRARLKALSLAERAGALMLVGIGSIVGSAFTVSTGIGLLVGGAGCIAISLLLTRPQ